MPPAVNVVLDGCEDVEVAIGHLFACGATSVRIRRLSPGQERAARRMALPPELVAEHPAEGGVAFVLRNPPSAPPPPPAAPPCLERYA